MKKEAFNQTIGEIRKEALLEIEAILKDEKYKGDDSVVDELEYENIDETLKDDISREINKVEDLKVVIEGILTKMNEDIKDIEVFL